MKFFLSFDPDGRQREMICAYNTGFLSSVYRLKSSDTKIGHEDPIDVRLRIKEIIEELKDRGVTFESRDPNTLGKIRHERSQQARAFKSRIVRHPTRGELPGHIWLLLRADGYCRLKAEGFGASTAEYFESQEILAEIESSLNSRWGRLISLARSFGEQRECQKLYCYLDYDTNWVCRMTLTMTDKDGKNELLVLERDSSEENFKPLRSHNRR